MRWLVVLLVACGGSAKPAPAPKPAATDQCARAADGMVHVLPAAKDPDAAEAVDKLRVLIRDRCRADGWSPEAQRCWGDAKTADDLNVCGTLLTDDQQAALVKAQDPHAK